MLDEVEELHLVLDHYAITWGVKLPDEQRPATHVVHAVDQQKWLEWGLKPHAVRD